MKLAVFEPQAVGHHMILHVRHIVREALARGWEVCLVTTPESLEHPSTQLVIRESAGQLQTRLMRTVSTRPWTRWHPLNLLRQQWERYRAFADAYRNLARSDKPDIIYVVHLDYLDKMISLLGSPFQDTPFAGMQLFTRFHHRHMGVKSRSSRLDTLAGYAFLRLLSRSSLRRLITIDEPLAHYIQKRRPELQTKLRYVPDIGALTPGCTKTQAREALGLDDDDCAVLVYGGISQRKGLGHLLDAAVSDACRVRVVIIIAGRTDAQVNRLLQSPAANLLRLRGQLRERRGVLTDEEEWQVFRAADIAWVGYTGFYGMSGILAQAGCIGLPVIACDEGLIGWMCARYGLGEVVDVSDTPKVVRAIHRLFREHNPAGNVGKPSADFAALHAATAFSRGICDALVLQGGPDQSTGRECVHDKR
ncbi:MAG: hypothetical protein R6W75_00710 [Smithellaceae bacterium]